MNSLDTVLKERLDEISNAGLHRELRRIDSAQGTRILMNGVNSINFSSNDYLGLANHPALKEAAIKAVETFGTGSGASRLICGSLKPHHDLESALAEMKGSGAALSFSSGYNAALGTICALMSDKDIIIIDKRIHACIVDAAKLSGAKLRVFSHNNMDSLSEILEWATKQSLQKENKETPRVLVITESVFSMDGDIAPLKTIVELKNRHGAWLMVDEAHATGLFGEKRSGLIEQLGLSGQVEIQMGTLGKALGSSGGYICGSKKLIEYLVNRARSFIFSTAPAPGSSAAALAAVKLLGSGEGARLCNHLSRNIAQTFHLLTNSERSDGPLQSAIFPIIIGDESEAVQIFHSMREKGFFIPAVRFPTVSRGKARLRLTLTASHTPEEIDGFFKVLNQIMPNTVSANKPTPQEIK